VPTVLRQGPYRFFFYSGDRQEPPHVHVERESKLAKFWLSPIRLQASTGFSSPELARIQLLIEENPELLLRAWNEFFAD
jgi:hypothetical protein